MGSASDRTFEVLDDPRPEDMSLPAFMVSTTRGFLPRLDPIVNLPGEFAVLDDILQRMPIQKKDGSPGLLAECRLGEVVEKELPDLTDFVDMYRENLPLMNALYRDYSFLTSAYLLEPCHERYVRGEEYGLARDVLPRQISRPMAKCADICGFKPWMEYAGSYALFNWRLEDPDLGLIYPNLRLIRAFENGHDPSSSEAGFVLVHVDMVKDSGVLVAGTMTSFDACSAPAPSRQNLVGGLGKMLAAMQKVNKTMDTMWTKSKPTSYTKFRTFIFGITSQSMFPNGVLYEGVSEKPMEFRGESGANDSMVPLMDNFLQIEMPDTPLTEILRDFRKYRPSNHKDFLAFVKDRSRELHVKDYALAKDQDVSRASDEDRDLVKETRRLWIMLLDQVREFRWRHWCFAREYILKQTAHPTATGGSPIVTWLPNQLEAVLAEMERIYAAAKGEGEWDLGEDCRAIMDRVSRQRVALEKEVAKYCAERGLLG